MNILITGVDGFVGSHLTNELKDHGHTVVGVTMSSSTIKNSLIDKTIECNLLDLNSVDNINLKGIDVVIHLAGLASNAESFNNPSMFINSNSDMTINLLAHIQKSQSNIRTIVVSSGAVYKFGQKLPLTETSHTYASSPYVISKLLMENICEYYLNLGLDIVIARPFNHIGPGQRSGFLVPDLAKQLQDYSKNKKVIKVGNLKTCRDYLDVRDVARAYRLLATTKNLANKTYNICSGSSTSGEELLLLLSEALGLKNKPTVSIDKSILRPFEELNVYGDYSLINSAVHWQPEIKIEETIIDFVENLN